MAKWYTNFRFSQLFHCSNQLEKTEQTKQTVRPYIDVCMLHFADESPHPVTKKNNRQNEGDFTLPIGKYQLWDSNPHSFELDFESSASTNSAKLA